MQIAKSSFTTFFLASCPQLGNHTIWFQSCILNMHIFTNLDFSHCHPHPHCMCIFLSGQITIIVFENGIIIKPDRRMKTQIPQKVRIPNVFGKQAIFGLTSCAKSFSVSQKIQRQSIRHLRYPSGKSKMFFKQARCPIGYVTSRKPCHSRVFELGI